jgi:hypothetical protein
VAPRAGGGILPTSHFTAIFDGALATDTVGRGWREVKGGVDMMPASSIRAEAEIIKASVSIATVIGETYYSSGTADN